MGKPLVFNIQKYSIHDGSGIRTTVFFKGCPLSCKWCHNPESQRFEKELLFHADRCTGCGACSIVCRAGAISMKDSDYKALPRMNRALCEMCGACVTACPHNAREEAGKEYDLPDLIRELEKDRMFYEQSGGGITLSGGEVLAQNMDYIEELARRLYEKGISVDIDTCGHVPYDRFQRVLPYADTFLYDLKLMDPEAHKRYTGVDNRLILENLKRLSADGGKINIRLPLIAGVNACDRHIEEVISFLKGGNIRVHRVNLLKYHSTGSSKYGKLGRTYDEDGMAVPDGDWLERTREVFLRHGFTNTEIGG